MAAVTRETYAPCRAEEDPRTAGQVGARTGQPSAPCQDGHAADQVQADLNVVVLTLTCEGASELGAHFLLPQRRSPRRQDRES